MKSMPNADRSHTAFFFKQWGVWGKDTKRRSKKANGREYRGRTWDEMPAIASRKVVRVCNGDGKRMTKKQYEWAAGAALEEHSRRKHKILREYFFNYLTVRCQLPHQSRFRLAIIDGFAGGRTLPVRDRRFATHLLRGAPEGHRIRERTPRCSGIRYSRDRVPARVE